VSVVCQYVLVWGVLCFRVHQGKSVVDEVSEISSTEALCSGDVRLFDTVVTNKQQISSSPFTENTVSPFTLTAKPSTTGISPKKSPLSSSAAAVGISRTSSGISRARSFTADGHVAAGSSFMKSDHISRLDFNSVSTTSVTGDADSAVQWLASFTEARTPGESFMSPSQPLGSLTSPVDSIEDDMSPPILKPKVRRASHRTPDKSPLVTSSSGDALELVKPSVGLGQPPGSVSSDTVDIEAEQSHSFAALESAINSTLSGFSSSVAENELDEQSLYDRLPENTKQPPAGDGYSSDRRNSSKISRPSPRGKLTPKSGSRSAKQKTKSPATEQHEKQRAELDNAFEAACRLPSTVRGQPSLATDAPSVKTSRRSTLDSHKVSSASSSSSSSDKSD